MPGYRPLGGIEGPLARCVAGKYTVDRQRAGIKRRMWAPKRPLSRCWVVVGLWDAMADDAVPGRGDVMVGARS